jgi:DNA topoisomerase-1
MVLVKIFPDVFSVDFTSGMEAELDRVEDGELQWRAVLQDFYTPFRKRLDEGKDKGEEIIRDSVAADAGPCPECGNELAVRWNRYGRFLGCTGYPECRYTKSLDDEQRKEPVPTGEKCEKCGGEMVEREGRFGPFIACSNYPKCKHTKPRTIPGLTCPQCGSGEVGEKRTRRGKPFWGCTRYPECDWSTWDEPIARPCPNCKAPYLVRKNTKARGEFLRCQTCAHEYTIGADDSLEPAGVGVPTPAERRARKADGSEQRGSGRRAKSTGRAGTRIGASDPPTGAAATKSTAKKSTAAKSPAKKSTAKKSTAKKSTAKKSTAKKRKE